MEPLRAVGVALALALAAVVGLAVPATAETPPVNVSTPVDEWQACAPDPAAEACYDAALADIDYARSLEGLPAMVLPAAFASMDPGRQAFVVTNLERVDRGMRP